MKSDLPYLGHIADSIAAIERYISAGHAYWSVDLQLVWDVIENELPAVKSEVHQLRAELSCFNPNPRNCE